MKNKQFTQRDFLDRNVPSLGQEYTPPFGEVYFPLVTFGTQSLKSFKWLRMDSARKKWDQKQFLPFEFDSTSIEHTTTAYKQTNTMYINCK